MRKRKIKLEVVKVCRKESGELVGIGIVYNQQEKHKTIGLSLAVGGVFNLDYGDALKKYTVEPIDLKLD